MHVIINRQSGTALRLGEDGITALLERHMPENPHPMEFLDSVAIPSRLESLRSEKDGVLVGGGDGTAMCAAEILGPAGIPFGILPMGTMNLLAQDLGAAPTLEETLTAIDRFHQDVMDVGLVNGRSFLCSAVVGFVPESAVVREELRETGSIQTMALFLDTIRRGMTGDIRQTFTLKSRPHDVGVSHETTSLIVSNNAFVRNPLEGNHRFLRQSLSDGKLAVYSAAPRDMMDGLKMALSLWQGDWQDHESVRSFETTELIVETQQPSILISLDGEPVEMTSPLNFSVAPASLNVLRMELKA